jgi:hypothetical protein
MVLTLQAINNLGNWAGPPVSTWGFLTVFNLTHTQKGQPTAKF